MNKASLEVYRSVRKHGAFALYRVGLLPRRYRVIAAKHMMFKGSRPIWDEHGYWRLDPMPTTATLDAYYQSTYWAQRGGRGILLWPRDLDHFLLIRPHLPAGNLRVLNFGAGHGGISHLLHMIGADVTNVEPGGLRSALDGDRWKTVDTIDQAAGPFDLVYGSHSLEHVQDVDSFMGKLRARLAPRALVFFEVPNCRQSNCADPMNGGQTGKIVPPHTYYFTLDFFRGLAFKPIILSTYGHGEFPDSRYIAAANEDGPVIRYLASNSPA